MITTQKRLQGFYDEQIDEILVRAYGTTQAAGYVAGINITPAYVNYSDILNVDLVLTEYPQILAGRFEFDYANSTKRIARRNGRGLGKFEHLHLFANQNQINLLLKNFGKKMWLDGDEIALEHPGNCWFWQTIKAVEMLEVDQDNPLHKIVRDAERAASLSGETACHSVAVQTVSDGCEICCGSGMSGHFAAGATGMAAYGGSIAQNSLKKARESGIESFRNSDAGKNKEAADRLDMQNRVENLRNQQNRR